MKTKKEIVENWLPRYTGTQIKDFGKCILLTNFYGYLELFSLWHKVPINGKEKVMPSGALLLVSDQPMVASGIKTEQSDKNVNEQFSLQHLRIGIDSLQYIINKKISIKHLKFD